MAVVLGTPDVVIIGISLFFYINYFCFSKLKGYGMMAVEEWTLNDKGEVESKNPSRYKIPEVGNLPRDFNVTLLSDSPNKQAIVYSSKVVILNIIYSYFCYRLRYLDLPSRFKFIAHVIVIFYISNIIFIKSAQKD